jgi:hypothetical protein
VRPISIHSVALIDILVNGNKSTNLSDFTRNVLRVFRRLFSRNRGPLNAAPSPRLKHYSSPSGHHYEYWYEGHRAYRSRTDSGTEFVFRMAAVRKGGLSVAVFLSTGILQAWEKSHAREFSAAERYAIAKMALFQAFDEGAGPSEMGAAVLLSESDLEALVARLNIE